MPKHERFFVQMDVNTRTGRRDGGTPGNEHCEDLGAYDNNELLLAFASNHDLAMLNTLFSNGAGNRKRIDYILTRQRARKHVWNVVVHPQPSFLPISDHNAVEAHVRLLGRFARNRPVRRDTELPLNPNSGK